MKTINNYKNEIRKMLFVSVEKDINKWVQKNKNDFFSPEYKGFGLNVDVPHGELFLCKYNQLGVEHNYNTILRFKFLFIPLDYKVYKYSKIIKRHFKKIEEDKQNEKQINFFKEGLSNIEENFLKEVRKEKIEKINESR